MVSMGQITRLVAFALHLVRALATDGVCTAGACDDPLKDGSVAASALLQSRSKVGQQAEGDDDGDDAPTPTAGPTTTAGPTMPSPTAGPTAAPTPTAGPTMPSPTAGPTAPAPTPAPTTPVQWFIGKKRQKCTKVCKQVGGTCDETTLLSVNRKRELRRIAAKVGGASCSSYKSRPTAYSPYIVISGKETGLCSYGISKKSEHVRTCNAHTPWSVKRFCPCENRAGDL